MWGLAGAQGRCAWQRCCGGAPLPWAAMSARLTAVVPPSSALQAVRSGMEENDLEAVVKATQAGLLLPAACCSVLRMDAAQAVCYRC